jgi:dipeptidyl aminopeptidase/acylaminoacyl peptidase
MEAAMAAKMVAPYGSWKSPITSDLIVSETIGLMAPRFSGEDIYWVEMRPKEGGRSVIVRRTPDGATNDITPQGFNARTRVHEYGGVPYTVDGGTVYFTNFADQRLYKQPFGGAPEAISPAADIRFADAVVDHRRDRLVAVVEDHTLGGQYPANTIGALHIDGGSPTTLVDGYDFFSNPRISPDGSRLCWLAWNHPNMPWDGCELWVADFAENGSVVSSKRVAGSREESIYEPEWSPDGTLYFISDRSGWWNPCRLRGGRVEPLVKMDAEFGLPQWVFGTAMYAFQSHERILSAYSQRGVWHLATLDTASRRLETLPLPYTVILYVSVSGNRALFVAASPPEPASIILMDLETGALKPLRRSTNVQMDAGYIATPQPIEFPTENGLTAHALYYPPANKDYEGPKGELPPLVVHSHGGPTGAASSAFSLSNQYWTSRGIAIVDVNYGGSTGYGRKYRERLNDQWGIVDVDDCVNAAQYLVREKKADGTRLAIAGGSAGGYTTLCALAFRKVFAAGASHFGVSDAEALAKDTHKFESRYLDRLIGPYPARRDLYLERSPVNYVDNLSCPVIFFQGLEDKIVPPDQAERMVEALKAKGLPVAYVAFEGEQHGFSKAESIKRALDGELYFYSRVFGFALADKIEPVKIYNLD